MAENYPPGVRQIVVKQFVERFGIDTLHFLCKDMDFPLHPGETREVCTVCAAGV